MGRDLVITLPSIGGSGYLTLAETIADAAIKAGYYAVVYQCRGLAQAEGPMCLDVWISEKEIHGSVPQEINYMDAYEMTEIWRMFTEAGNRAEKVYSKDLTVISDYRVIEPIAVMTSIKGPRYYSREELLELLKNYKIGGNPPKIILYDFSKYKEYPSVLKGPYSFGVMIADLEKRKDEDLLKIPLEEAKKVVYESAPPKKGVPEKNVEIFEKGYRDRMKFKGEETSKVIFI
ncbi:MAG: 2-oxoacid:acceptor oxidoreductase family protein [Candidatus Hydrothermarchaeota archaeon]